VHNVESGKQSAVLCAVVHAENIVVFDFSIKVIDPK